MARAIHRKSTRRNGAMVQVNCAAIPEELIESELFGHEKGSFTGAVRRQTGKFVSAHGGTIFLDEVGDMSPRTQAKVLRVLQNGEVEPVGAEKTIQVDVRVMAATNRDLEEEIAGGRFREDLFYRLERHPGAHAAAARAPRRRAGARRLLRQPLLARQQRPPEGVRGRTPSPSCRRCPGRATCASSRTSSNGC